MRWLVLVVALGFAGCRKDQPAPPVIPSSTIGGDLTDPGAGSGDVVVATVDGRPVWGSCVAGHVQARRVSVDEAVQACIDLELLAAEAVRRGLLADGDTQTELRAALVDGFVGAEFEDKIRTPADLPANVVEASVHNNARELDRPEIRSVVYARALFGPKEGPRLAVGTPEDEAAHQLAIDIHAELAGRDDLFPHDLFAAVERVAGARFVKVNKTGWNTPRSGPGVNEEFAAGIFAIPGIGQVSPPIRSPWGWDVILLTDILPPRTKTREELIADLFPGLRRGFFDQVWTRQIQTQHEVEVHAENLAEPGDEPAGEPAGSGAPR